MATGYGVCVHIVYDYRANFVSIIKICFLYKIVEAAEPVNPYDNRTAVATSVWRPLGNGDTGSLQALKTHCRPNVNGA